MIHLNIHKIRSFVTVAELKAFRRAAEKLHISASALSTHVRELEEMLGVPLLERTTRKVGLTVEGARFLTRAREILASLDDAVGDVRATAVKREGHLTIGCIPTVTESVLPQAMAAFGKTHRDIALHILDTGSRQIVRHLNHGDADFGIVPLLNHRNDIEATPLIDDPIVAVVPSNHPMAKQRQIPFAVLSRHPFIALNGGNLRAALKSAERECGVVLSPAFELEHHHSALSLVRAGYGITALPSLALCGINMKGLVALDIVEPSMIRHLGIIRRKDNAASGAAEDFQAALTSTVNALADSRRERRV